VIQSHLHGNMSLSRLLNWLLRISLGLKVNYLMGMWLIVFLPVRIHDLDNADIKECESVLGSVLRGIEFIYKEPGGKQTLRSEEDIQVIILIKLFTATD